MVGSIDLQAQLRDPASLVVDSPDDFRVSHRNYTRPEIFELEMDKIFSSTWVFVAHESEVALPGDYKTAYIGLQPVIVSRDEDGSIHVLFNRCRHRGAVVCREHQGHAEYFQCLYHGWTYNNRGDLTGIAQSAGYPGDFPQKELGLQAVARVEIYRGLIFASVNAQVRSLEEHLGLAKEMIDVWLDASTTGKIELGSARQNYRYQANWKFICENTVDGYHGNYVHRSAQEVSARTRDNAVLRGNRGQERSVTGQVEYRELGGTRGFPGGHGVLDRPFFAERFEQLKQESPWAEYYTELERLHGKDRAVDILGQHNTYIFPNMFIAAGPHLRVVQPISVDVTQVYQYAYKIDGAPDGLNSERLRRVEQFQGPAGFGTPDDVEAFIACQSGMAADAVEGIILSRGLYREQVDSNGTRHGHSTDETPQRALHREWKRLMSA